MADEEFFTFAGGRYRPIISDRSTLTPVPMPANNGEWVKIPYGGNIYQSDGRSLHTVWNVQIWIPSTADYNLFKSKYQQFAALSTPWGTRTARLASLDVAHNLNDGSWRGQATFEWP